VTLDLESRRTQTWLRGPVEQKWFTGIKTRGKELLRVVTYRCPKCGYLKTFAPPVRLLEPSAWHGQIWLDGTQAGGGSKYAVREPATCADLGQVGRVGIDEVHAASVMASEAQSGWAAASYDERAVVLRRAGDLWTR